MKHFKKIALLMMAAVFLTVLPSGNALKVSAAEPTKHLVIYQDGDWRCYVGGSTVEDSQEAEHWETYYLQQDFKDGDILVIQGTDPNGQQLELDLSGRRIGNLTVTQGSSVIIVKAGSIDECHLLGNSTSSITAPISNAYVYDTAVATFCSDVDTLHVVGTDVEVHATIGCQGAVNHVIAKDDTWVRYEYYSVAKGKLEILAGSWQTENGYYSAAPMAPTATVPAASNTPAAANNAPAASASAASNEYDQVPKTGDNSFAVWMLLFAAASLTVARTALKKAN